MSHRDNCPDRYTARREGERAFDYGRGIYSNPYDGGCDEASEEWRRGYREAEDRRGEEEAAERTAERRHQEYLDEQRYLEERFYAEQCPEQPMPEEEPQK
jgi:hypothetical protein